MHFYTAMEFSAGRGHSSVGGDTGEGDLARAVGYRVPRLHVLVIDKTIHAGGEPQGSVGASRGDGNIHVIAGKARLLTVVESVPSDDEFFGGAVDAEAAAVGEAVSHAVHAVQGGLGQRGIQRIPVFSCLNGQLEFLAGIFKILYLKVMVAKPVVLVGTVLGDTVLFHLGENYVVDVIRLLVVRVFVLAKSDAQRQHPFIITFNSRLLEPFPHLVGLAVREIPVAQLQHIGHGIKFLFGIGKLLYLGKDILVVLLKSDLAVLQPPLLEFFHAAHDGLYQCFILVILIHVTKFLSDHVSARRETALDRALRDAHTFGDIADG